MSVDELRAASFRIRYALHDGPGDDDPVAIDAWTRMAIYDLARGPPAQARPDGAGLPHPVGDRDRALVPDADERGDLGAFVARVVRLDPAASARLRAGAAGGTVTAWASTPFDVLATRTVHGHVDPSDVTVPRTRCSRRWPWSSAATVDPGAGGLWPGDLPPDTGWSPVDVVPAAEIDALTERGLAVARENAGPLGPPTSLLDQNVLTVSAPAGPTVKVPLRCLFALSGMGFVGGDGEVRVSATGGWLRLDAHYGAVVRRRTLTLPLLV